jgi:tetratricopeptide (TPR) repeat protein
LNFDFAHPPKPTVQSPTNVPDTFDFADFPDAASASAAPATPEAASEAAAPPGAESEDFEVDVAEPSAPEATAGATPEDDSLEMLSFADSSAVSSADVAVATRYHVRRKTGKVFGPFDQSIIIKMLQDGQLAGTEDISEDRNEWSPIGSVAAFRDVISGLAGSSEPPPAPEEPSSNDEMSRLKRLYEGRMAAVNIARSNSPLDIIRERAKYILIALGVLAALGAGVSLGLTRYGAFGVRKLFSTRVSRSSAEYAMLQNARKDFLADTYKSYREANELATAVLKVRDYPEARAVWCESVFYLHRRFGAAKPEDVAKASASLEDIELLGRKDLDYVKANAGAGLARGKAAQVLGILQEAAARNENAGDLELALLLAEAYANQGQQRLAMETVNKALDRHKGSARALHALGNLYQASNDTEKASKAYNAALEADASHLSSAIELAALELLFRNKAEKALKLLEPAGGDKGAAFLGPTELARARALRGAALQMQGDRKTAIAELEQALKLDPTSTFAKERLAQLWVAQHDYDKALPLYQDVVNKEPQNLSATEGLLSSLIGLAKMDDALKAVAQANSRFPGKARIAYFDGRVNEALDKTEEAETHYKRAINSDPKLIDATLYLARLYLRLRRIPEAKAELERALPATPKDAQVRAAVGELALMETDVPRARAEFQKAVELDGRLAEGHLGLSKVALEDGSLDTALTESEKVLELDPRLKDARFHHGFVLWKLGKLDESVDELQKARSEDPKATRISIVLGAVMLDKGDLAGAETNLLSALTADPINPEGHYYLGKVKNRRGEHSQAIDSMRNALDRAPNRPDYHYQMGVVYRDAKRMSDAIQEWKRALELDANQADSLEALGQAYLDRGNFEDAISAFEQTLRADGKRTRVLALIGDCHFQAAKWDKAIAAYSSALKVDASLTQVFYKLGRCYTEKGRHAPAIEWYRKAIAAEPDKPMAFYYLGYAQKEKHHRKDAIEAFKSYLALRPDAEDKKEIEDEIYDLQHE